MKHYLFRILCIAGTFAAVISCGGKKAAKEAEEAAREQARLDSLKQVEMEQKLQEAEQKVARLPEEPVFNISTNLGTIKVKLYSKTPLHRDNFAKLALAGYYDGVLFHRVINGFMIQGGDPNSKDSTLVKEYGKGGPGYTIPAEFVPEYRHKKGALAAARRGDASNPERESSGSQFYLVQDEGSCAQLDGAYTVFGETLEGIEVIDKIAAVPTNSADLPINPVVIKSVELDPSCAVEEPQTEADETAEEIKEAQ